VAFIRSQVGSLSDHHANSLQAKNATMVLYSYEETVDLSPFDQIPRAKTALEAK
jgi:hypothetical protein